MPTEDQIGRQLDRLQELLQLVRNSTRPDKAELISDIRAKIRNRRNFLRTMVMARNAQEEADRAAAYAAREAEIDNMLVDEGIREG
jgi:hypothetical protein